MLALGDKIDIGTRLEAYIVWAQALLQRPGGQIAADSRDAYTKTKNAAADGLKTLASWQKPDKMTDDQFAKAEEQHRDSIQFRRRHGGIGPERLQVRGGFL